MEVKANALPLLIRQQLSQAADELAVANTALFEFAGVNRLDIVNKMLKRICPNRLTFLQRGRVSQSKTDVQLFAELYGSTTRERADYFLPISCLRSHCN